MVVITQILICNEYIELSEPLLNQSEEHRISQSDRVCTLVKRQYELSCILKMSNAALRLRSITLYEAIGSSPYLIGALPSDVTSLIAREPEEKCNDYSHIRGMLRQWFKLTAQKFRELFSRHRKNPNGTWKDFEIRAYFEGWLNELKIDSFDGLKNLIADQMKKRCSPECKEHYLDIWEELLSPEMLADKLEAFDNIRRPLPSGPMRYVKASETINDGRLASFSKPERPPKREYSHQVPNERSPLRYYGCGKQGVIKSR
ncbi:uncharacterized protein TNCV_5032831 [Trichonephila clavipes]|nr:uncharacterized protein TNCV_5032831 [Trichonephila clavipes]